MPPKDITLTTAENTGETPQKGEWPHKLTTEERRRGAARTNELRRERAKSHAERLRERLEAIEEELLETVFEQAKSDWRALMALYDRAYGTPAKAEPERIELDVGSGEARGVSLSEIIGVSQARDNAGLNGEAPSERLDQAKQQDS